METPFVYAISRKQNAQPEICPPSRLSISVEYQARQQYLSRWFIWIITDFVYKRHCSGHHTIPLSADRKCTRNAGKSAPLLCRSFPNGIRVSFHPCPPRSQILSVSSPPSPFPGQPRPPSALPRPRSRNRRRSRLRSSTLSLRTSTSTRTRRPSTIS